MPTGIYPYSNMNLRRAFGSSSTCIRISTLAALLLTASLVMGCQQRSNLEEQKNRTLTQDERYLVELYMKITEFEENLQDNPEMAGEKREELRDDIDLERIQRVLDELEEDPERWLAIYNRIHELKRRRSSDPPS